MKPSVIQILNIGKDMGYSDIEQAYFDYMRHWDCFFLIEKYGEQYADLVDEFKKYNLLQYVDGKMYLKQITIDEALKIVETYDETKN